MLKQEETVLVIIDVQGKLAQLMHKKEELFENLQKIIKGARVLGIPIIWLEQNPAGLGPTIPEVASLLSDIKPISKFSFSCCGDERFISALNSLNRKQVLLAGIETHICVYQTAADLVGLGYDVQIVADAVSSRAKENKKIGLERMREIGASLTSTETALFELLRTARADKFKEIARIVK
jgi:nicotinamidase-related amidase